MNKYIAIIEFRPNVMLDTPNGTQPSFAGIINYVSGMTGIGEKVKSCFVERHGTYGDNYDEDVYTDTPNKMYLLLDGCDQKHLLDCMVALEEYGRDFSCIPEEGIHIEHASEEDFKKYEDGPEFHEIEWAAFTKQLV